MISKKIGNEELASSAIFMQDKKKGGKKK